MHIKIILEQPRGFYSIKHIEPLDALLLSEFLTVDVGSRASWFLEWFKNPENSAGSGNATDYEIDEGVMTIIPEWQPDYDECIRKGNYFSIRFDLVLELLRQWGPVYNAQPPYIIITIL